jgi:hypothetical protein
MHSIATQTTDTQPEWLLDALDFDDYIVELNDALLGQGNPPLSRDHIRHVNLCWQSGFDADYCIANLHRMEEFEQDLREDAGHC